MTRQVSSLTQSMPDLQKALLSGEGGGWVESRKMNRNKDKLIGSEGRGHKLVDGYET